MSTITAGDVRAARFTATKFREGYDTLDVDTYLERIASSMDALLAGEAGRDTLTADDVLTVKFRATKFRAGYDQDEVDDFLDVVVLTLRAGPAPAEARRGSPLQGESRTGMLAAAADPSGAWVRAALSDLTPLRFAPGYSIADVDALLRRAAEALDRRTDSGHVLVSAEELRRASFATTWWRTGYPRDDVGALMATVVAALRE